MSYDKNYTAGIPDGFHFISDGSLFVFIDGHWHHCGKVADFECPKELCQDDHDGEPCTDDCMNA